MDRAPRRRGGGTSKGERRQLATRIPVGAADAIEARADALGIYVSDYIGALILRDLGLPTLDLTLPTEQDTLPIESA